MRALVSRTALLLSTLLGAGCSIVYGDELDSKQCKVHGDCEAAASRLGAPLVCRENACQAPTCDDGSPCPSGSMCAEGLCIAASGGPSADVGSDAAPESVACTHDTDCDSEQQELCGLDGFCYGKWACLDQDPDWPVAPANLDFQLQLFDSTQAPTAGIKASVAACTAEDPSCSRPIVVNGDVKIAADNLLTVPFSGLSSSGFVGTIRIESAVASSGILPSYIHFTGENPLVSSFKAPRPLQLIAQSRLQGLAAFTMITASPDAAGLFMHIFDCGGQPASEVSLTPSNAPGSVVIPLQGSAGLVLGSNKTTADGTLIVINLPPNLAQVFTLRDEETGRVLSDTFNFIPRGPAVNMVMYYPRHAAVEEWAEEAERANSPQ